LYEDAPASIGGAVFKAMVLMGLFRGVTVQREDLLRYAQELHRAANGGETWPQQETLGRELRGRGAGVVRQMVYDRLLNYGWQIVSDDGRVWCERAGMTPYPYDDLPEQLR
jgi:hypothetical protein